MEFVAVFCAINEYPRKPITAFHATSIDRTNWPLYLLFRDDDSQITVTLWTRQHFLGSLSSLKPTDFVGLVINALRFVLAISTSDHTLTARHIVRQLLSNLRMRLNSEFGALRRFTATMVKG